MTYVLLLLYHDCADFMIPGAFAQDEPQDQTAVERVSTGINIRCNRGRGEQAPFWFINHTLHELFSIPIEFPFIPIVDSYTTLTIPVVTAELNNTFFQCVVIETNGEVVYGTNVRLLIMIIPG